jgi:hypothetical protein
LPFYNWPLAWFSLTVQRGILVHRLLSSWLSRSWVRRVLTMDEISDQNLGLIGVVLSQISLVPWISVVEMLFIISLALIPETLRWIWLHNATGFRWNYGQVISSTVWIPILLDYVHSVLRKLFHLSLLI